MKKASMLLSLIALAAPAVAFAAPEVKPDFKTPPDWKAEVIGHPPEVKWPSVVEQAPDGRIFIGEHGEDMPGPAGEPIDRILCIFPDGHITVFADKLWAVFALRYIDGKLIVHESPILEVFTDDNGVGKDRKVLIPSTYKMAAGNNLHDHIPANVRVGMDNYLYLSTGDKGVFGAKSAVDGSTGEIHGGGVLRFREDGSDIQVYSTGTRNSLDVAMNDEDEIFTYDNTDDGQGWWTRYSHLVDGGYYGYPYDFKIPGKPEFYGHNGEKRDPTKPFQPWTLWRMDEFGGGSPCGAVGYNEDALPPEYYGNLIHCEWGKGNLERFVVARQGGTYRIVKREILLTGGGIRPLGVSVMSDGTGFLIADWEMGGWHDPRICGRLIKLTYTGKLNAAPLPSWYLPAAMGQKFEATTTELIAGLSHPAERVRLVAQRRLAERPQKAIGPLIALMQDVKAPPYARWHAIWTLDRIDGGSSAIDQIIGLAKDPKTETSVRRQAIRQLGTRAPREAAAPLIPLLNDPDASIRFRTATALGRIGDAAAVPALLNKLDEPDFFTHYAIFVALRRIGHATPTAWTQIAAGLKTDKAAQREGITLAAHDAYDLPLVEGLAAVVNDQSASPVAKAAALETIAPLHRQRPAWNGDWWGTQPAGSPPPEKTVEWSGTGIVLQTIQTGLRSDSPVVRSAALRALEIAPDPQAGKLLTELFAKEPDLGVKKVILKAMGSSPSPDAVKIGVSLLNDDAANQPLIPDAIDLLGTINSPECSKPLIDYLSTHPAKADLVFPAIERMHAAAAVPEVAKLCSSPDEKIASGAADLIGKIGNDQSGPLLKPVLADNRATVRRSAATAAGAAHCRGLIPDLVTLYEKDEPNRSAVITALAQMPDSRALDAYLAGLGGQDAGVRDVSRKAIKELGQAVLPTIEAKLDSPMPLSAAQVAELQQIYVMAQPIGTWRVLGPFAKDGVDPVGIDKLLTTPNLTSIDNKPVAWKTLYGTDAHGRTDLGGNLSPNQHVSAYAVADIQSTTDREATFTVGSDDGMVLWVNGEMIYKSLDDRGYNFEQARIKGKLKTGTNKIIARITQDGGPWEFSVAVSGERTGKLFTYDTSGNAPAAYANFANSHPGNPDAGNTIFHNAQGVGCIKCHTVAGQGGIVGPNLTDVGLKYPKQILIESVLYPSKQIESGYEQTLVRLKSGDVEAGVVRAETADELTLYDSTARKIVIRKADIQTRKVSPVSVMPEGLQTGLTHEQFADLIAYLTSLKQKP